jgi:hypothetical protein
LMGVGLVMEGVVMEGVGVCVGVDVGVDEDDVGEVAVGEGVAFAVFLLFEGVGLDVGDDGVGVGEVAVGEGVAFAVFLLLEGVGLDVGDDGVGVGVGEVAVGEGVGEGDAFSFEGVELAAVLDGEGVEGLSRLPFGSHVGVSQLPMVHVATFEGLAVYPGLHENVYVSPFFVPLPPATEFDVAKELQSWQ